MQSEYGMAGPFLMVFLIGLLILLYLLMSLIWHIARIAWLTLKRKKPATAQASATEVLEETAGSEENGSEPKEVSEVLKSDLK